MRKVSYQVVCIVRIDESNKVDPRLRLQRIAAHLGHVGAGCTSPPAALPKAMKRLRE